MTKEIPLLPWQQEVLDRVLSGERIYLFRGRKAGRTFLEKKVEEALEAKKK